MDAYFTDTQQIIIVSVACIIAWGLVVYSKYTEHKLNKKG